MSEDVNAVGNEAYKTTAEMNVSVEDAPDNVDLDALLGMGDSEGGSVENVTEDNIQVDYPHIKISKRHFMDVLKISNIIAQGSGKELSAKSIGMVADGKYLKVYLTDFDMFVSKDIEMIVDNPETVLTDFITLNLTIISKMVAACPSLFIIYKKDNKYFLKMVGGDMEIEPLRSDENQLRIKGLENFKPVCDMETSELCDIIKNMFNIANSAVTAAQRRVVFENNRAYVVYMYSIARYDSKNTLPKMDLSIKNMKILYILAQRCVSKVLRVSSANNRILISGVEDGGGGVSEFTYSFVTPTGSLPKDLIDSIDDMLVDDGKFYVDAVQLKNLTDLSTKLNYSTSRMEFNHTGDGFIKCILKTKRSDGDFTLKSTPVDGVRVFESNVSIHSNLLNSLLTVFNKEACIWMNLNTDGIAVRNDNYVGVLFTEGKANK